MAIRINETFNLRHTNLNPAVTRILTIRQGRRSDRNKMLSADKPPMVESTIGAISAFCYQIHETHRFNEL